jgi:hypothetical protein
MATLYSPTSRRHFNKLFWTRVLPTPYSRGQSS